MEAAHVPWRPLGELFVDRGLITEAELETALAEQAATGKRLGEILVDSGLVSGPDLTTTLMDQLGVEINKEEGYGSGLWAEIKRRHKRARHGDADDDAVDDHPEAELEPAAELALVADPEPAGEVELEQELNEIRADYTLPAEREPEPEAGPKPEPEPGAPWLVDAAVESEPESHAQPAAESDEVAVLRAELAEARADVARLQEMLADAMTALAAFHAEAAGRPYDI